jgi:tRNA(Ile)-lysidine synthase
VAEAAFDRLRLVRTSGVALAPQPLESTEGEVTWNAEWRLRWRPDAAPTTVDRIAWVTWARDGVPLGWRSMLPGDRLRPLGGPGRRSVARLLMEAKVPRLARERYPLLVSNDEVLWIPGVCRGEAALPTPGSRAVRIDAASEHLSPPDGRS